MKTRLLKIQKQFEEEHDLKIEALIKDDESEKTTDDNNDVNWVYKIT